jgi:hypothetical protein
MIRIRTAAAVSAAALVGVAVLAGCSSSSESAAASSAAASEAASPAASTEMLPPVIITADQTEATCAVGNALDIVIDEKDLAGTTVASSDESLVTVTQAKQDGDALFNPGGQCIAAGSAVITVTNPDSSTRDIALTITE